MIKDIFKQKKLTICFIVIIALFLSIGIITIQGIFTQHSLTRKIYDHPLVVSNASLTAALNITKMHRSMKDVVLANSEDELKTFISKVEKNETIVFQQLDIIRDRILGNEGQLLEKQTRNLFIAWKPIRTEVIYLLGIGKIDEAIFITKNKGADHVLKLEKKMLELTFYARNKANSFLEMAENNMSHLEKITITLVTMSVLISIFIASFAIILVSNSENILQGEKDKLQKALNEIQTLRGILPICSYCKQIRDDEGIWERIEDYIREHSEAEFTHGICPDCMKKHHPECCSPDSTDDA